MLVSLYYIQQVLGFTFRFTIKIPNNTNNKTTQVFSKRIIILEEEKTQVRNFNFFKTTLWCAHGFLLFLSFTRLNSQQFETLFVDQAKRAPYLFIYFLKIPLRHTGFPLLNPLLHIAEPNQQFKTLFNQPTAIVLFLPIEIIL